VCVCVCSALQDVGVNTSRPRRAGGRWGDLRHDELRTTRLGLKEWRLFAHRTNARCHRPLSWTAWFQNANYITILTPVLTAEPNAVCQRPGPRVDPLVPTTTQTGSQLTGCGRGRRGVGLRAHTGTWTPLPPPPPPPPPPRM